MTRSNGDSVPPATSHTPGPWRLSLHSGVSANGASIYAGKLRVATLPRAADRPYDTKEADGHLIASAPDLLAALKCAHMFIRNGIEFGFIRMPDADCPDPAKETPGIVRAAIAKAEGR